MRYARPGERTQLIILALFACFGVLYLAPKVLSILNARQQDYFDFELIWRAGTIWASGQNPYNSATWFYPPYWYPLIVPLGLLPFQSALTIWKVTNFFLLIVSTHLIARALADVTHQKYLPVFLAGLCFLSFMYATAVTVWSGQTSILVYFGLSALLYGLLKLRWSMVIVGLVFLALKPQFGLLAFVAVAAIPYFRWAVLPAGAICILASFAIAITADYRASIEGFIVSLSRHSEHAANTPAHLTGAIRILDFVYPISNAPIVTLIIFVAAVICIAILFHNLMPDKAAEPAATVHKIATLALFVAFSLFVLPLHYYDMIALTVLFMMIIVTPLAGRWLIGAGLFLAYRPDFIWRVLGVANPDEILLTPWISSGLLLTVVGAGWSLWRAPSHYRVEQS